MLNEKERRGWVEAMKELKAQYYVGSQAAFNYLKAMRWYEQVREEILQANPVLEQKFDLSVKRVAWLVLAMGDVLQLVLELVAARASSPGSFSLASDHEIVTPGLPSRWREIPEPDPSCHQWEINWPGCLGELLSDLVPGVSVVSHLRKWLEERFQDSELQLTHVVTGQSVSYAQFCGEANLRQGDEGHMWLEADNYLEEGESEILNAAEISLLRQAEAANDVVAAHSLLQRIAIDELRGNWENLKQWLNDAWENGYEEIEYFLYDMQLYHRAENEYTLGLTETERRILLNFVHDFCVHGCKRGSPQSLVDEMTEHLRLSLRRSAERLKVPEYVSDNEPQIFRHREYLCRAIHQNKKWLIDFLSH